ncbi:MAG: hypothetical protein H6Q13_3325, partial [Bacteroidetes bacterium]|nr:hypothetical protein [Bacteroidota bacterium]
TGAGDVQVSRFPDLPRALSGQERVH